jgi:uncharacterized protein
MTPLRYLLCLLLLVVALPADAQQFPALTGRVVDQANLLSPEQEADLTARLQALEQASSRQLVVATVSSLEGNDVADYGYQLGRHWRIGQKEANNGTILLVAPNERRVHIAVGYGLEPILTDALSHQIIQNDILPRFRANDYPGGIMAGADAIIAQLQAPPEQAEQRALEAAQSQQRASSGGGGGSIFPLIFWGFIFLFIILPMLRRGGRGRRYRRRGGMPVIIWGPGSGGGGWGSGGGGWGGGGGGGFGGFSGGGGSFGGGGASGGW